MIRNAFPVSAAAFFFLLSYSCHQTETKIPSDRDSNPSKGFLFIIGGGDRDDTLMQEMIDISGWKKGEFITVIPLPSTYDSSYYWINEQLERMTGQRCIRFDSMSIHDEKKLDSLSMSKIIFIGGGDQLRMMNLIATSRVKQIIKEAYANGATIGGTSAGASIMSEKMITGNQLLDTVYESTFPRIRSGNIELKEGLGLLDSVIIDQHFITRSRYNRLLSAVIEHPTFQCIGIDEATAIIVHGDSAIVSGESEVVVMEGPHDIEKGSDHLMGARGLHVSIFLPGEKLRIKK